MLQTQFRLKHFCSVLHLFVYRFEVWCYPKHYNQCKRGVEPLGTLLRNTLFSLQVPFVKQVAVYLKYVFFNCHFICCTVFRALLVTVRVFAKKAPIHQVISGLFLQIPCWQKYYLITVSITICCVLVIFRCDTISFLFFIVICWIENISWIFITVR